MLITCVSLDKFNDLIRPFRTSVAARHCHSERYYIIIRLLNHFKIIILLKRLVLTPGAILINQLGVFMGYKERKFQIVQACSFLSAAEFVTVLYKR